MEKQEDDTKSLRCKQVWVDNEVLRAFMTLDGITHYKEIPDYCSSVEKLE